jgi:CRP-like cAMP-binding protein
LRSVAHQVAETAYAPVELRLMRRLVRLYDLYADGRSEVSIPLTQEHLAGLAATTRSTVNRILRREEQQGVVRLTRGRVTILDADTLRKRAR